MSTAGYSGTPLPRKLGIREGGRVLLVGAPDGFADVLGELPPGVELVAEREADLDVAVLFAPDLPDAAGALRAAGRRASAGGRPLGRLAEAQLGRDDGSRREPRARARSGCGPGRQQGLRDRRDLVGPALRQASARPPRVAGLSG